MNDNRTSGGPNLGLLLLIPAAAIVARAAMRHHRAMWEEADGPEGAMTTHGHGHHHAAGSGCTHDGSRARRLPPRIERTLDDWHAKAHATPEASADTAGIDAPSA